MRRTLALGFVLSTVLTMTLGRTAPAAQMVVEPVLALPGAPAVAASPTTLSTTCPAVTRATTDRADVRTDSLVHAIYLVPSDTADESLDKNGVLDCSMRAMNAWLFSASGSIQWKLDTFGTGGTVDVTYVHSTLPGDQLNSAGEVSSELRSKGFNLSTKRYLSFVASGAGGVCGDAYWPTGIGAGPVDGQYSQVYLLSSAGCHAHEFGTPGAASWAEAIVQQEMIHNDGVVPIGAPHGCGPLGLPAHVCTGPLWIVPNLDPERTDVMFPYVTGPLQAKQLDRGHDDYFMHPDPLTRHLEYSDYVEPAP